MALRHAPWQEDRATPRDETWRRVRVADAQGARLPVLVVNLSPHGAMARVDEPVATGDRLLIDLPVVGPRAAEVRWSLGGRIGCRFEVAIPAEEYPRVLAMMR
ncbi:PilZ domain-containing protein [Sphingomonas corticis]|jgi:hypothetical protein|uniref:PilZ domain-containing protein n=1 Tax=Sphingomonas corticis TaxID=2722791 RepID=A0ABX1CH20_9SPHN|nr:PilZ domain-containing protein [Sphingomonas corticis]NJR77309.1 PilZ domain-containing protein [Sphingomonas corticis]